MKKARISIFILVLCLLTAAFCPAALADSAPEITAKSAFVVDMNTGTFLYEKDAGSKADPASTTKIMTMLLICEALERGDVSLDDKVTAEACDIELIVDTKASSAGITAGETMSFNDLCYCIMLASANEACNIAASHVAGSVDKFVKLMNEKASELGCNGTHFTNTNGLTDSNHYTTAHDLCYIAQEALKHDLFRELCGTIKYVVPPTNKSDKRVLSNSNALINADSMYGDKYVYNGTYGIKTGHTSNAGFCLVSANKSADLDLLAVVFGSSGDFSTEVFNNFSDTIKLYDWCKQNFSTRTVIDESETICTIPVKHGAENEVELCVSKSVSTLLPTDVDISSFARTPTLYVESVKAPVKTGDTLGQVTVTADDGEELCTVDLVAANDVEKNFIRRAASVLLILSAVTLIATFIPKKDKGNKKK